MMLREPFEFAAQVATWFASHLWPGPARKWKCLLLSCVWLFVIPWTVVRQAPLSMEFSKQEYGEGCHSLFQGIFPTQGLNSGLLHWNRFLIVWATSAKIWEMLEAARPAVGRTDDKHGKFY